MDVLRSVKDSYQRQNEKLETLNNKDNRELTTHRQRRRRRHAPPPRSVIPIVSADLVDGDRVPNGRCCNRERLVSERIDERRTLQVTCSPRPPTLSQRRNIIHLYVQCLKYGYISKVSSSPFRCLRSMGVANLVTPITLAFRFTIKPICTMWNLRCQIYVGST